MNITKKSAFTLVELIVVVTILWILSTIWFVSYNGYMPWVRDSNRIVQLDSMNSALELYSTTEPLPLPDNKISFTDGSETLLYQWNAGKNTLDIIGYSKAGKDPKDNNYFSYSVSKERKDFQLMVFLEKSDEINFWLLPQVYASDMSSRYPYTLGNNVGIILDLETKSPLHLSLSGEINISSITRRLAILFSKNIPRIWTGSGIGTAIQKLSKQKNTLPSNCLLLLQKEPNLKNKNDNYYIKGFEIGSYNNYYKAILENPSNLLSSNEQANALQLHEENYIRIDDLPCDMTTLWWGWTQIWSSNLPIGQSSPSTYNLFSYFKLFGNFRDIIISEATIDETIEWNNTWIVKNPTFYDENNNVINKQEALKDFLIYNTNSNYESAAKTMYIEGILWTASGWNSMDWCTGGTSATKNVWDTIRLKSGWNGSTLEMIVPDCAWDGAYSDTWTNVISSTVSNDNRRNIWFR